MTGEMQWFELVAAGVLFVTLLTAGFVDLFHHRIPNALLGAALVYALLFTAAASGVGGILLSLAGLAVGLAMLLPLYLLGGVGAGDVKLLGLVGAYLGPANTVIAGLAMFVAGGILAVLHICRRALRRDRDRRVSPNPGPAGSVAARAAVRKKITFAYAPAIGVGVIIAVWHQGWPFLASSG